MKNVPTFMQKSITVMAIVAMLTISAFAVPTSLTVQTLKQNNYAVQAGDLVLTMSACDATNGNSFIATGKEVLIAQNSGGSAFTITVTSVADDLGRTDTSLATYSLAAGAIVAVQMSSTKGWVSGSPAKVTLACSNVAVKFAVVRYQ